MYRAMPCIDLGLLRTSLPPEDYSIVECIVASKGKNKGRLRASKPPLTDDTNRLAAYV
jgi:hypothetical protein